MHFYTSAEIKEIKQHIKEQTATKEEIEVVLNDLFDHLDLRLTNLPHNYSGIFGQEAIEDIRKNYKEFFPKEMEEMIIEDKRHDFFDMIYTNFNLLERIGLYQTKIQNRNLMSEFFSSKEPRSVLSDLNLENTEADIRACIQPFQSPL